MEDPSQRPDKEPYLHASNAWSLPRFFPIWNNMAVAAARRDTYLHLEKKLEYIEGIQSYTTSGHESAFRCEVLT